MGAGQDLLIMVQALSHGHKMVLKQTSESMYKKTKRNGVTWISERYNPFAIVIRMVREIATYPIVQLTMSDFGATLQFSLQRLASPFTTSALLPIRRRRPMTFLRHV